MLHPPTLEELREISTKYRLNVDDEELKIYQGNIKHEVEAQNLLAAWKNPLHVDESKYKNREPRRAQPDENPYNAWYQKCQITGNRDPSKLLSGYKIGLKDNIFIAGVPLMNGSKVMEGFVPEFDATVVTRVLEKGGTIIGSTTCENLCLSGASFNTTYGPVRNPWNPQYSAGGSSSGSGVVVATGEVNVALGGDQGGSIRIPASSCGVVGLKPTYGLVPYTGIISIDLSLDHTGPIARSVSDCARLLQAIAGFDDGKDFRQPSCGFAVPNYLEEVSSVKPGTLKIGVLKEGFHGCDESILNCIDHAIELIKKSQKFVAVQETSIPDHDNALLPYWVLFGGTLNQIFDSYGYGTGCSGVLSSSLVKKLSAGLHEHAHTLHPTAKQCILSAAYTRKLFKTAFFSNYAQGQTWGWVLKNEYDQALSNVDVLLMPTLNKLPAKIPGPEASVSEVLEGSVNMIRNTAPFDQTHHPALTLNAGYDEQTGLPIGLQLVGKLWEDSTVLKAAKIIEEILKPLQRPFPH